MARKSEQRRGVLLLVVLSMLVVFLLIGVTFVMVANQQKDAAKAATTMAQTGNAPKNLLDGAMYQLLRDTNNSLSAIRGHSLLRDMYGDDAVLGAVDQLRATALVADDRWPVYRVYHPAPATRRCAERLRRVLQRLCPDVPRRQSA